MNTSPRASGVGALRRGGAQGPRAGIAIAPPRHRWLTRLALPAAVVLVAAGLLVTSAWSTIVPATEVTATTVVERASGGGDHGAIPTTAVVQAAGWFEADPYLTYATSLTDGIIEEVLVLEGERVEAGQVLARLVPDDAELALARARSEVSNAEAEVQSARARLEAARTDWENPTERHRAVAVGEARLAENHALLAQLAEEVRSGESDVERLRSDYDRIAPLGASAVVSESEVIDARTFLEARLSAVEALRKRRDVVRAQIQREEAELLAAREYLRLRTPEKRALEEAEAGLARARATLDHARARLAEAELRVSRLEVRAPVDGIIVERFKSPGNKIMRGMDDPNSAAVASLYDPAHLQARVDVPLADASKIAVGQRAEVTADILPNQVFAGTVSRVLHVADIQKNTLQAKVAIEDPSPLLRPEMLARVKFLAAPAESGAAAVADTILYAPADGVRDGFAWVVSGFDGKKGRAQRRSVETIGDSRDGWLRVASGLQPGDIVITSPTAGLTDRTLVRVQLANR